MIFKHGWVAELFEADVTLVWLFSARIMGFHMNFQRSFEFEGHVTAVTLMGLFIRVDFHVNVQIAFLVERLFARLTLIGLFTSMNSLMLD